MSNGGPWWCVWAALLCAAAPSFCAEDGSTRATVVVLYPDDRVLPETHAWDSGLRATLAAPPGRVLELRNEFLDAAGGAGDAPALVDYLRRKYEGVRVALVVPVTTPAYAFVARHRDEIFRGAPAVFCSVDRTGLAR